MSAGGIAAVELVLSNSTEFPAAANVAFTADHKA
jgi:hypothetical protein